MPLPVPSPSPEPIWPPTAIPGRPRAHLSDPPAASTEVSPKLVQEDRPIKRDSSLIEPIAEGEQVLTDLAAEIKRYVVLPNKEAVTAVTLWVAATHLQTAWQHAPRLAVVGPAKRCGKSRLLDVVTETVRAPLITVNASPAAIFRSITHEDPPTLLVDEADTLFGTAKAAERNEDLRGLLNAGHQRNRPTLRVSGPEHKPQAFPTFAMAALAGIGDLPDTIMDRSVVIRMRRRAPGETVASFRTVRDTPALHTIRDRLTDWLQPELSEATGREPDMPVEDRAADTWEPLVIVADLAGGDWPTLARTACRAMTAHESGKDADTGLRTRILIDIRRVFSAEGDPATLRTSRLIEELNGDPESPWAEHGPTGLNPRRLGLLLEDYSIRPANHRFPDGVQAKGYARTQFFDAWARYCPAPTANSPLPAQRPAATGPAANTGA
ncbi:DUF3631 domain-containing protein [Streptomyces sp. 150FB]|uniref:DUF3631 domain-containing protein n=1 Tax=Streptomyces sp. 150FB TaxID=1576605 RepID=UPI001F4097ED|nr:DUF3631 domain-containing protein [Streptomyces sp. 150FB]